MELQFQKSRLACLRPALNEVRNQEQTQELKLSDAMPDIGRIITCWGQVILRGKEWRRDSATGSGGIMVWVLYGPEDGSAPRTLETWIPFQMKWDLPEGTEEGTLRLEGRLRSLDARSVSPRKIMLRAGIGVLAEALEPVSVDVFAPTELPDDMALLKNTYPIRLLREAGEKSFQLDEELTLPPDAPAPDKLIAYRLNSRLLESKILDQKILFRGCCELNARYLSEEGRLCGWDFEIPFSQYTQLEGEPGEDTNVDLSLGITDLDLTLDAEGHFRARCGVVAQYVTDGRVLLEVAEDACSPRRDVELLRDTPDLPILLDSRSETVRGVQSIPLDGDVVDTVFLPDFPRQRRSEGGIHLEIPCSLQVLYYAPDGSLQSTQCRWVENHSIPMDGDCQMFANGKPLAAPKASLEAGSLNVQTELQLDQRTQSSGGITMISGMRMGEIREPDAARPSVILRRAGKKRLWDIAKESGSTVEAIRNTNQLAGEAAEGQLLLIPVV